ncbi:MAG: hypothetical protein ACYYNF_00485 [Actinomycetes bacterium]
MMLTTVRSAEEFYGRCMADAHILDEAARRRAERNDAVGALASAWGSDIYAVQGVLWERVMGAAGASWRQVYRASGALFSGLGALAVETEPSNGADVLSTARTQLLADCDEVLRTSIRSAWTDTSYLSGLKAPRATDVAESIEARLEGHSGQTFIARRRAQASDFMDEAFTTRVRGDTVQALSLAYDADFASFEGYLVESAIAAGDHALASVYIRWDLATAAILALPGIPDTFVAGVRAVRRTLCEGLSDADAARFSATLISVA